MVYYCIIITNHAPSNLPVLYVLVSKRRLISLWCTYW